jgi:hypothetical protein
MISATIPSIRSRLFSLDGFQLSAASVSMDLPVQDALQTFSREIVRDFSLKRNRGKDLGAKDRAPPF